MSPGDMFVAVRGDRFDGNAYVAEAVRKGAIGAIVSDPALSGAAGLAETPLVVVPDTIAALQMLANRVRRDSGAAVVAVTGSAGKSTTKEFAAEFLAARYTVFRNRGNLNNHIGLPLSLLELRTKPDIGVFELGMNHFGEISALVKIAEPEVRVWTNVGPAHLEFFGTVDAIAEAKAEILEGADKDSLLVANADDDLVMRHASKFGGRVRTFGVERPADVRALAVRDLGIDGTAAIVRTPIGEAEIRTPLPGTANLSNVLAAAAVAIRFDVPLNDVVERAARLKPFARRGEVIRAGGVTIVDDSYNSNPKALSRALALLAVETRYSRRIAVVGEMLELGAASSGLHRAAGEEAARSNVSDLVAVGGDNARAMAESAVAAGMPAPHVHYVGNSKDAADLAATLVRAGDLVLVKGSRGIRTEVVVERLKAELA
jgi:UDP-N-acetylmuramoyl-tripeptide--D-alanyl-D-alanine ligase